MRSTYSRPHLWHIYLALLGSGQERRVYGIETPSDNGLNPLTPSNYCAVILKKNGC